MTVRSGGRTRQVGRSLRFLNVVLMLPTLTILQASSGQAAELQQICLSTPTVECLEEAARKLKVTLTVPSQQAEIAVGYVDVAIAAGQLDTAIARIPEIGDGALEAVAHSKLSVAFSGRSHFDAAEEQLAFAWQSARALNNPRRESAALADIVDELIQGGLLDPATRTASRISDGPYRARSLSKIGVSLRYAAENAEIVFQEALATALTTNETYLGQRDDLLAEVISEYANASNLSAVDQLVTEIENAISKGKTYAAAMGNIPPNESVVLDAYRNKAQQQLASITDPVGQAHVLAHLGGSEAKVERVNDAKSSFNLARSLLSTVVCCTTTTEELVYRKQADNQLFHDAIETVGDIDFDFNRQEGMAYVTVRLAEAGQIEDAVKTAEDIMDVEDAKFRSNALEAIAIAVAKAGDVPGGVASAATIQDQFTRARTYLQIARVIADQ